MKVRIFKELTIDWDWLGHNVMARDLCKECNYTRTPTQPCHQEEPAASLTVGPLLSVELWNVCDYAHGSLPKNPTQLYCQKQSVMLRLNCGHRPLQSLQQVTTICSEVVGKSGRRSIVVPACLHHVVLSSSIAGHVSPQPQPRHK